MILSLVLEEMRRAPTTLTLKVSSTLLWATEIVRIFEKAQQTSTPQSSQLVLKYFGNHLGFFLFTLCSSIETLGVLQVHTEL